jgi:sugar/nucleoside kinase (ribokinase family)
MDITALGEIGLPLFLLRYNIFMPLLVPLEPVDYLVIGHLSCDITPDGPRLGGTAAYAALTGRALGLRVGVVTAWGGEVSLDVLDGIKVQTVPAKRSTTFENKYTSAGRIQHIHHVAPDLSFGNVPETWRRTPIVHIGPIAGEAKSLVDGNFQSSLLGLTPQGWLRKWDGAGRVGPGDWPEAQKMLSKAGAAVLSIEDVGGNEDCMEAMATACRVLAVTEGPAGARLYWNGDLRRFRAPSLEEIDATGAGDIFAAAFFWRLYVTRDPWAAARFATHIASFSVKRSGLDGIPTQEEIQTCLVEVM